MALTTQQIHASADQLHAQGIKPTLAEVRKALGGGSFTTISEAMKSWRQEHQEEQALKQVELPSGITERLQTLGADMWQTAIDIAHERLTKEREALEQIKAHTQQEVEQLAESVQTLEKEQAELLQQLDEMSATAETAAATADKTTVERDTLKQSLSDQAHQLELVQHESSNAQSQLTEVRSALAQKSEALSSSLANYAKLEGISDNQKTQMARLENELKAAHKDLKEITAKSNKLQLANAELKGELKAVIGERDKLSIDNAERLALYHELSIAHTTLETEHKALNESHAKLQQAQDDLQDSHYDVSEKYVSEQNKTVGLQQQIAALEAQLSSQLTEK